MKDREEIGNSFVEIDLDKIVDNMERIRRHVGQGVAIMPVLKANACGHGLLEMARLLVTECGIDRLAVGQVREAERLREGGIDRDIMVLGGVPENNLACAVRRNLITPMFQAGYARRLSELARAENRTARVHLKIDTGLGRIGVRTGSELDTLLSDIGGLPNLEIEGVFTHFGEAEVPDPSFTNRQIADFDAAVAQIRARGIEPRYVHATNTPSVARFRRAHYNMVRTGLLWLGYDPCTDAENRLGVETVLEWRSFVTSVRQVEAGTALGYCRSYTATRETKVAIGSFGYGDGYLEDLGKKGGCVLIRGQKAPLISVCMDQAFIDVTDIRDVGVGDVVTLIGHDGAEKIDAFDMEKITGNSYVFYLCNIGERAVRTYVHKNPTRRASERK